MSPAAVESLLKSLEGQSAQEITRWAVAQEGAIVTTNFRPYEAIILHLATQAAPEVPILWVDHGTNLPETYRFAEKCREQLRLNLKPYLPDEVERVESFSRIMKLEPFERGMRELAPKIWITALRKEQNPQRAASLKPVMWDAKFNCLKVNPILEWTPTEMDAYLAEHKLPNERTYYDPAKGDEKHECGLHAPLTTPAA
jgi:phosphoadenosine phosphosulfate reductase